MFASMSSSIAYVRADKLRALAITIATRSPVLPDLPTVAEFVPGYEFSFWTGIGAPRNTPAEIVDKLKPFRFMEWTNDGYGGYSSP